MTLTRILCDTSILDIVIPYISTLSLFSYHFIYCLNPIPSHLYIGDAQFFGLQIGHISEFENFIFNIIVLHLSFL